MFHTSVVIARGYYRINVIGWYMGDKLLMQYFKVGRNKQTKKLREYIKIINNSHSTWGFVSCLFPKE